MAIDNDIVAVDVTLDKEQVLSIVEAYIFVSRVCKRNKKPMPKGMLDIAKGFVKLKKDYFGN